ncbi:hypothetical protein SOVF_187830 [Spinacia oleracea]|uniref:Histone H1 n=1 Tax=Spinacia oleracea TaxID=3562 RepID=A0A9R0K1M1_SPIOL|nr:histone H1-like [Spinacia oleracea]KNA05682.1 hypothetical protein SOVF_187830 [Spinacia oleracea]
MAAAPKTVKKVTAPKKAAAAKSSPSHPPYIDMITEALVSLKERTGSSHYAIAKHIEEQQKVKDLPPNFKKLLFNQLKKCVASGKLVMVKKSFKLPSAASKKSSSPVAAPAAAEKVKAKPKSKEVAEKKPAKKEAAAKPKAAAAKPKAAEKPKAAPVKKQKVAAKSPAKKVAPVKAKKLKSIKSPAKKATAVKKTVPMKKAKK